MQSRYLGKISEFSRICACGLLLVVVVVAVQGREGVVEGGSGGGKVGVVCERE